MRQQLEEQQAAAAKLRQSLASAEQAAAATREELTAAQARAAEAEAQAAQVAQMEEDVKAYKQQLKEASAAAGRCWVETDCTELSTQQMGGRAQLLLPVLCCAVLCCAVLHASRQQPARSPDFAPLPPCPQAWVAADKAVMDLRYGRMEREELKFKVGLGGGCGYAASVGRHSLGWLGRKGSEFIRLGGAGALKPRAAWIAVPHTPVRSHLLCLPSIALRSLAPAAAQRLPTRRQRRHRQPRRRWSRSWLSSRLPPLRCRCAGRPGREGWLLLLVVCTLLAVYRVSAVGKLPQAACFFSVSLVQEKLDAALVEAKHAKHLERKVRAQLTNCVCPCVFDLGQLGRLAVLDGCWHRPALVSGLPAASRLSPGSLS